MNKLGKIDLIKYFYLKIKEYLKKKVKNYLNFNAYLMKYNDTNKLKTSTKLIELVLYVALRFKQQTKKEKHLFLKIQNSNI